MNKNKKQNEPLRREFNGAIRSDSVDLENRTFEFSFSSEEPVTRYIAGDIGYEILDHSPGSADLERINNGGAFLNQHDRDQQIGVVTKAWLDEKEKKLRAAVKMSQSQLGQEILNDINDGIRQNVSFAYELRDKPKPDQSNSTEKYQAWRYFDWSVLEVSTVSIPADYKVGIGREHKEIKMGDEDKISVEIAEKEKELAVEQAKTETRKQLEAEQAEKRKRGS